MNKKKKDLASELGVSEVTIWRWEKAGILDKKIKEIKERNKQTGLQKDTLQSITDVLQRNNDIIQSITNEMQQNKEILQNITNVLQAITSKMGTITEVLQKNYNVLQDISNVIQSNIQSEGMKYNVSHHIMNEKSDVIQSNTSEIEGNCTTAKLAKMLGVNQTTIQRWITKGEIKATKTTTGYVIPKDEALRLVFKKVYEDLNVARHFGGSVPIPIFKDEVKKTFNIKDEEIDEILLDLDTKEIIYLQTLDNPGDFNDSDRGIKFKGRILYFITWMKK
jgi:excisionase family DNA binding protein